MFLQGSNSSREISLIVTSVWPPSCPGRSSHTHRASLFASFVICADICQSEEQAVCSGRSHVNQTFLINSAASSTSLSFCLTSEWQMAAAAEVVLIWRGEGRRIHTFSHWQQTVARVTLHIITEQLKEERAEMKSPPGAPVWGINSISDCPGLSDSCQVRAEDSTRCEGQQSTSFIMCEVTFSWFWLDVCVCFL